MSCVAPLRATTASKAMHTAKKDGRCRASATSPKPIPETSWVVTTKNFLVLNISRKGLHRNLRVQGNIMTDVQRAILLSSMPSPLNISTHTIFSTTNGSPIAKYALGTHRSGEWRRPVLIIVLLSVVISVKDSQHNILRRLRSANGPENLYCAGYTGLKTTAWPPSGDMTMSKVSAASVPITEILYAVLSGARVPSGWSTIRASGSSA